MLIFIFVGYFVVRFIVDFVLRKKLPKEKFPLWSFRITAVTSLIFGALLLFSLQGVKDFWGRAAGFLLLLDSFLAVVSLMRWNNMKS